MKQHQYNRDGVIWFGKPIFTLLLRLFGRKLFIMPKDWTSYSKAFGLHMRGETPTGDKFVWCPRTMLMSWSREDYKQRWCHGCQLHFEEVRHV